MNGIRIALLLCCLVLVAESFSVTNTKEPACDALCSRANWGNDLHKNCCTSKGYNGASCSINNGKANGSCVKMG